jgi:hypothetical protein
MKQGKRTDILTNVSKNKKQINKNNTINIVLEKLLYIQDIIRNTILSIKRNKTEEIFSNNDTTLSISILTDLYEKTSKIEETIKNENNYNMEELIDSFQKVIDKLSMVICGFGTSHIEDLLFISFGSDFKKIQNANPILQSKYELIKKYIRPIGYKIIHWKKTTTYESKNILCENKITEENIDIENYNTIECFDIENKNEPFYHQVYGVRVLIQNEKARKSLIITGIIEDLHIDCFSNEYITKRKEELKQLMVAFPTNEKYIIKRIIETISFKDILIYGNNDIVKKMITIITDVKTIKSNKLDKTMNTFLELDTISKRNMLINLLLFDKDSDVQYISYLLYEVLSVDSTDNNKNEQHIIYNSLPWKIKTNFKEVIKETITTANNMIQKYDINQITLEQQIYLMKADDKIKEKAILKLKEIKGKPDEMGLKAKQYIEGLLKIPFNIYREEPSLKQIKNINNWFIRLISIFKTLLPNFRFNEKDQYTLLEINHNMKFINNHMYENILQIINTNINSLNIKQLNAIIQKINSYKKSNKELRLTITNQSKTSQISKVYDFLNGIDNNTDNTIIYELFDTVITDKANSLTNVKQELRLLKTNINKVEENINNIMQTLDKSIYAHTHAKNQIMKIIGQWMNGEQTGYCFGFEGSPGIGKTSMAKKGLSMCLKDDDGEPRPFSFIALGGSCNGSTLEGHSYTYLNSTWGKIVEILMESKCMNPIIYVDELDKVSKTENGREIIGIFTHLIDQTQNDCFQDKYFSGVNIDLSKALFIFSYNDPEQIDKILLDRIHRIKFENLTLDEKIVIVKRFILPEINKKMRFNDVVDMSDKMIEYIIDTYTMEPGVRKLKELLFDLYGEINLDILKNNDTDTTLPIKITVDNLENKYLPKYEKVVEKYIHKNPVIGTINGLWANSLGRGGIIPIQTMLYPTPIFLDLRLTGLQGDVMKESMNVAKSLAWNLTSNTIKKKLITQFTDTKCQGLHIHCPEGAISKDGPSAGAAITTAIYSLFNNKKIDNTIAMTGEINLQGEVTKIGGLDMKISGGIKAGVKTFLYPKSNSREYNEWKKNANETLYEDIHFYEVSTIQEVFKIVFA